MEKRICTEVFHVITRCPRRKEGVIYQACRKDVTRALSDSSFVPRWSKTCTNRECCIKCKNIVFASLHKTKIDHINEVLHALNLESSLYHTYATMQAALPCSIQQKKLQTHCITCHVSLQHSHPKPYPQTSAIEDYLRNNTGFQGSIGENDMVCYSCYQSHLFVLRQSKTISMGRDLNELINTIDEKKTYHAIH